MSKYKTPILVGLVAVLLLIVGFKIYKDTFMEQGPQGSGGGRLPVDTLISIESLNNKTYTLISYNGVTIPIEEGKQEYTLTFGEATTGQKNNYSAKFCNGMGGVYSVTGSTITGTVIGTMMYCESPANLMTMENEFAEMLNTGATAKNSGAFLTLTGNKGQKFVYSASE